MLALLSVVENVFSARLPLNEEVLSVYDNGYVDKNVWWGSWLRKSQQSLEAGAVSPEVAPYVMEASFPRFLAAALIDSIRHGTRESNDFIHAICSSYCLLVRTNTPKLAARYTSLTEDEAYVTLVCLYWLQKSEAPYFRQRGSNDTIVYGSWLANRSCLGDRTREFKASRMLCRLVACVSHDGLSTTKHCGGTDCLQGRE